MRAEPASQPLPRDGRNRPGFLVVLPQQADLTRYYALQPGAGRKSAVWQALVQVAEQTQGSWRELVTSLRDANQVDRHRFLTSPNALAIYPTAGNERAVLDRLSALGPAAIYDAIEGNRLLPPPAGAPAAPPRASAPTAGLPAVFSATTRAPSADAPTSALPWNLQMIGTERAWKAGATGVGMVYGSIDSGVDASHPALAHNYRGRQLGSHDYSWFDVGDPDWPTSAQPFDRQGHGTHTTSIAVGRSERSPLGVAPQASWIATRALVGSNRMEKILRALEWMQAPTRRDGSNPRPDLAPDVVGMSLSAAPPDSDLYARSIDNLAAAGILTVASAGNDVPRPASIHSPANGPTVVSVTSVDRNGALSSAVPLGPSQLRDRNGNPLLKPDLAAPGILVRGALPDGKFAELTGTSMAQPHVAGALLALRSLHPTRDPLAARAAIVASARDLGTPGWDVQYGAGLLDLDAAIAAMQPPGNR